MIRLRSNPGPSALVLALIAAACLPFASTLPRMPRLEVVAPSRAAVGEAFVVELRAVDVDDVAGFEAELAVSSDLASVEGSTATDAMTDLSINDLGARGVAAGVVAEGADPLSGTVTLGRFTVRPTAAGHLALALPPALVVDADGNPLEVGDHARTLEVAVGEPALGIDADVPGPTALGALADLGAPPVSQEVDEISPAQAGELQAEWHLARDASTPAPTCGGPDLNGNGCVDIGDVVRARGLTTSNAAAPVTNATGATFTVNTTNDKWDITVGNGVCASAPGECSLRAAIQEANASPGPNTIAFAIAGSGVRTINLTQKLPTINDTSGPVTIDGYTQPGAQPNTEPVADNAVINIAIAGTGATAFDAFAVISPGNTFRGLAVYNVRKPFWLYTSAAADNRLVGNFIGTDPTATFVSPEFAQLAYGVNAEQDAPRTIVGTPALADRNVISGNAAQGIGWWHNNTDGGKIQNNIVGLSPDGTRRVPNRRHGIDLNFGVSETLVGGTQPGERNVISGNDSSGVEISHTTKTADNLITGNLIGTDLTGESAPAYAANLDTGVYVEDGSSDNVITGNVIGNSGHGGITIINGGTNGVTRGTVVRGNLIGVSLGGNPLPNGTAGISVDGSDSLIESNVIANTTGPGIRSQEPTASGNRITRNVVMANTGLTIDLAPLGVHNSNDIDDVDAGPNGLLNFPVWTRATNRVLSGTACAGCTVEVFRSASSTPTPTISFLAATSAAGDGSFSITNPTVAIGTVLVATATDAAGSTSELSDPITAVDHNDAPVITLGPVPSVDEGGSGPLTATATDPDGDSIALAWDLDGNGSFETSGADVTFSAVGLDGPSNAAVAVRATDGRGLTTTLPVSVPITNVAPTAVFTAPTTTVEGATFLGQLSGPADASPADVAQGLRFAFACDGSSLAQVTYEQAGTSSAITCPGIDGPSTPTVRARVIDKDGGATDYSLGVGVSNVAPTVQIVGPPQVVDEGASVTLAATADDPSAADVSAGIALDWSVAGSTGTGSPFTFVPIDDGTLAVTATATDKDGGSSTASASLSVRNVAPTGSFLTDVTVGIGIHATLRIEGATDPGAADLAAGLRFAFSCDGSALTSATYATASTSNQTVCSYFDGLSNHFVRAVVLDKDGGRSDYSTTATSGDAQPPSVSVPSSFTVVEGQSVTLTATGTNPAGGALTYRWDLDGDGDPETLGQQPTFSAATLDGPTQRLVTVRVTNADGLSTEANTTVNIENRAPTATLAPVTVDEGDPATIALTSISDAAADVPGLRYAFSCSGAPLDAVTWSGAGTTPTTTCTFPDGPANPVVRARVLDDDGAVADLSVVVTVRNKPPVVVFDQVPSGVSEGQAVSAHFVATDVPADTATPLGLSWTVRQGGSTVAAGTGQTPAWTATGSGSYVITAQAVDKDGGTGTQTATVSVGGTPPTATLAAPTTGTEGASVTISLTGATDASPADLAAGLHFAFSCTGASLAAATYATSGTQSSTTCTLPDGPSTVTFRARVIDQGGLFTEYSAAASVSNVAPTARLSAPVETIVGDTIPVTLDQVVDPSSADVSAGLEFAIGCGTPATQFSPSPSTTCPAAPGPTTTISAAVRDRDGASTSYSAVVVVHANLLANNGFENDADADGNPDGWIWSPGNVVLDPTVVRTGAKAANQTSTDSVTTLLQHDAAVQARRPYVASAWFDVRGGGSSSATVRIRWLDANGNQLLSVPSSTLTTTTSGWVQLSRSYIAPTGATTARVELNVVTAGGRTVRMDDAAFRADSDLVNADLESDTNADGKPDTWFQTGRFTTSTSVRYQGTMSGRLAGDGTTFSPGQRIYNLVAGTRYYVSLWINVPDPNDTFSVQPRVRWLNSTETTIRLDHLPIVRDTTGWFQISGSFVAPAGVLDTLLEVTFYYLDSAAYIDGAYLGQI